MFIYATMMELQVIYFMSLCPKFVLESLYVCEQHTYYLSFLRNAIILF